MMMDIQELRQHIDTIDRELVALYCSRMEVSRAIGEYKRENNLPVRDSERERAVFWSYVITRIAASAQAYRKAEQAREKH